MRSQVLLLFVVCLLHFFLLSTVVTTSAHNSTNSIGTSLAGCKFGEKRTGLSSVKSYLERYGYLSPSKNMKNTFDDNFDHDLESAVIAYQRFFHLKVTGTLDESTIDSMRRPRCGVADINHTNTTGVHGRTLFSFFPGVPTWPPNRRALRYIFSGSRSRITAPVLRAVYRRAFNRWQSVTLLSFTEVTNPAQADIFIQFFAGDHGDGFPFDGRLGVLAHAFAPTIGYLHFDASELWTASAANAASPELTRFVNAIDLESVAIHEIGHNLGLMHSTVPNAIMFPTINLNTRNVILSADDITGIRTLYGVRF